MKKILIFVLVLLSIFCFASCKDTNLIICPTCGYENASNVKFCSDCGASLLESDGNQNNGENNSNTPCQHSFGGWQETVSANCVNTGTKERTCSKCLHKETETVAALGHTTTTGVCGRCNQRIGWSKEELQNIVQIHDVYVDDIDSVGGVDMRISWTNTSDKTIKYIHFYVVPYNAVGDKMYCDIRDYSRFDAYVTGPCEPGYQGYYKIGDIYYGNLWENCWYNNSIKTIKLVGIKIIYMDESIIDIDENDISKTIVKFSPLKEGYGIDEAFIEYYPDDYRHRFFWAIDYLGVSVRPNVNIDVRIVNDDNVEVFTGGYYAKSENFTQVNMYGVKKWMIATSVYDYEITDGYVSTGTFYYHIYSDDGEIDLGECSVSIDNLPLIDWSLYLTLTTHGYDLDYSWTWSELITLHDTSLGKTIVIDSINYEFINGNINEKVDLSVVLTGKNVSVCPNGFYISGYFVNQETDTKEFFGGYTSATQNGEVFELTLKVTNISVGNYVMEFSNRLIDENGLIYNLRNDLTSYSVSAYTHSKTTIAIPEKFNGKNVTRIAYPYFENYKSLTSIHIPKTINSMGNGIFDGCDSLKTITIDTNNPIYYSEGNCIIDKNTKILYSGCNNSIIPNDVIKIGNLAFYGCTKIESIVIPASVESIGIMAFTGCSTLKTVTINSKNLQIDDSAFEDCVSLTELDLTGVKSLSFSVFWGCANLSTVSFDTSLESIGSYTFENCSENETIIINFSGTKNEWNAINKDEDWYGDTTSVIVKCSNGNITYEKLSNE